MNNRFTKVPDILFDTWMPTLSEAELKTLLIIVRQTFGWNKARDEISHSQFMKKTGLSQRAITGAIESLSNQNLIRITDQKGSILTADERRYRKSITYEILNPPKAKYAFAKAENSNIPRQNMPLTIDKYKQQEIGTSPSKPRRQTDPERVECVLRRQKDGTCSCFRCS